MSTPSIFSRSTAHVNNQRRWNPHPPQRSIFERNGKKFVVELQERMERRYVQVYDEAAGRMRLFEVIDYIPTRTVRPLRYAGMPPPVTSNFSRFNQRTVTPLPRGMSRPASTTPSRLLDFHGLGRKLEMPLA